MARTLELEIDDIHDLMFQSLMQDRDDAPALEDWAEDTLMAILYQAYRGQDNEPVPQAEGADIVEDAQQ